MSRLLRGVIVTLAAALVSGCGGLPTQGPVTAGRPVDAGVGNPVRIEPPGPVPGQTPAQAAQGFVQAGAGFQSTADGPDVARLFLSPDSAAEWQPTSSVLVYTSELDVQVPADGASAVVTAQITGRIDGDGRYRDLAPGTRASVEFGLTRIDGEVRLTLPKEQFGLWITEADLYRLFTPSPIYFVSPLERRLVPETRWFASGAGLATSLARALIEPVPEYLSGAVITGFPTGTTLGVDAVPVIDGVAEVTLSQAAASADDEALRAMYAQAVLTLTRSSTISRVRLLVGDAPLDIPGLGESIGSISDVAYAGPASNTPSEGLLRRGTVMESVEVSGLAGSEFADRDPPLATGETGWPAIPKGWTNLALSVDGRELASVGGDLKEVRRWREGASLAAPITATSLTRPSYDSAGWLWIAGRAGGKTRVFVLARTSRSATPFERIDVPWLEDRSVSALRISPDGTRALVVSRGGTSSGTAGGTRLDLVGIRRSDEDARPTGFSEPRREGHVLSLIRDATWLDAGSIGVLGRRNDSEEVRALVLNQGEGLGRQYASATPAAVPTAVAITSVGGARGLVVRTDTGQVQVRAGSSWLGIRGATDLVLPGA